MRHFVGLAFVTIFSYSLGFTFATRAIPIWLILLGGIAWLSADFGAALLADYAAYRTNPAANTFSRRLGNPLLSLKGAWGVFLVAFLFVLIGFLSLHDRGWILPLISLGGLGARYALASISPLSRPLRASLVAIGFTLLPFLSSFALSRF